MSKKKTQVSQDNHPQSTAQEQSVSATAELAPQLEYCGNCRYWIQRNSTMGGCHRNPPASSPAGGPQLDGPERYIGLWPLTKISDLCGEFACRIS
jgi:hypothetical protein